MKRSRRHQSIPFQKPSLSSKTFRTEILTLQEFNIHNIAKYNLIIPLYQFHTPQDWLNPLYLELQTSSNTVNSIPDFCPLPRDSFKFWQSFWTYTKYIVNFIEIPKSTQKIIRKYIIPISWMNQPFIAVRYLPNNLSLIIYRFVS